MGGSPRHKVIHKKVMMPSKHYEDKRRSIRSIVQGGRDGTFPCVRVIWYLEGVQTCEVQGAGGESKLRVKSVHTTTPNGEGFSSGQPLGVGKRV